MNSPSTTNTMAAHHNFIDICMKASPVLFRRTADEAIVSESENELSRCASEEDSCSSVSSSSFDFFNISSAVQHVFDDFSDSFQETIGSNVAIRIDNRLNRWQVDDETEEDEARRQELRQADARNQKRHVIENTKLILMDNEKFREFKRAINQTGMLTAAGVQQVLLSPTVDDRQSCGRYNTKQ